MPEYFHNWFPQRIISQLVSLIVSTLLFIIVGCYWFFSKHSANHGPTSSKVMWRSGNKVCSVTFVDRRGSTKREVTWNYCICNRLKQACVVLCALALSVTLLHKQKRTVLNRSLAGFGVHLFEKKGGSSPVCRFNLSMGCGLCAFLHLFASGRSILVNTST